MLTARTDADDVVVGLESGADDYVDQAVRGARAGPRRRAVLAAAPPRSPSAPLGVGELEGRRGGVLRPRDPALELALHRDGVQAAAASSRGGPGRVCHPRAAARGGLGVRVPRRLAAGRRRGRAAARGRSRRTRARPRIVPTVRGVGYRFERPELSELRRHLTLTFVLVAGASRSVRPRGRRTTMLARDASKSDALRSRRGALRSRARRGGSSLLSRAHRDPHGVLTADAARRPVADDRRRRSSGVLE